MVVIKVGQNSKVIVNLCWESAEIFIINQSDLTKCERNKTLTNQLRGLHVWVAIVPYFTTKQKHTKCTRKGSLIDYSGIMTLFKRQFYCFYLSAILYSPLCTCTITDLL